MTIEVDWPTRLARWREQYGCRVLTPVSAERRDAVAEQLRLPAELMAFYGHCNGLALNGFSVLPVEDPANIRRTWNGIVRANDSQKTQFLEGDVDLLARFAVFADIGDGCCAVIERKTGALWFEEGDALVLSTMRLDGLIEACLKDAAG